MTLIRRMTFEELTQQIQWAKQEGWEPGGSDPELFWNLDPDGFLAMEQENQFIGGGAIIRHSEQYGFMGLFIVDQKYRGQGLGTKLWYARRDQLLERLAPEGCIGLDGVYEMVPFYEKGGFRQETTHRRFRLDLPSSAAQKQDSICELSSIDWSKVIELDRQCFPASRESFLKQWVSQPTAIAYGCVSNGTLHGYGVMRACPSGWRVAPLFAESYEAANALFLAFQTHQAGKPLFLDVPDDNPHAQKLCREYGMEESFGCVRMYYGNSPSFDRQKVFGVTTFEVG